MPVDFLTADQQRSYGRYAGEPSRAQLGQYFHLDDRDRGVIDQLREDHTRLGFAVQLATVRFLGTFLVDPRDVPPAAVAYLAGQLNIADHTSLERYLDRPATQREHTAEIRRRYGYRDFSEQPDHFRLVRWLHARAWLSSERPSVLFDLATARLVERKVLLPGVTTLERLVASVRDRAIERLWHRLAAAPDDNQRTRLDQLLVVPAGERVSPLERLRRGPTRATAPALVEALRRLAEVRALGVGNLDLSSIPAGHIRTLARYAATSWASVIARMPAARRTATLVAFARVFEATAQDDALDVLDLMIGTLLARVENEGDQARLRTLRDLDAAALRLRDACRVVLDPRYPDFELREAMLAAAGGEERLEMAVTAVTALTRPPEDHYYEDLLSRYGQMRQFLPTLLRTVSFDGTAAGRPVLDAVAFLRRIEGQRKPDLSDTPPRPEAQAGLRQPRAPVPATPVRRVGTFAPHRRVLPLARERQRAYELRAVLAPDPPVRCAGQRPGDRRRRPTPPRPTDDFRHGAAVHQVRHGIPLSEVQQQLGHARIDTTSIYTKLANPERRALADRVEW